MTNKSSLVITLLAVTAAWAASLLPAGPAEKTHKLTHISPQKMADSLHAVIAADRQAYAEMIVQRLAIDETRIPIAEDWRQAHGLPMHAQLLRQAAQNIQKGGAEFSYTLRSLWPINSNQGPQTQAEQDGLDSVAQRPDKPYYTEEELGGRSYFTAVYADRATLSSCVQCHNQHPKSPRHDFNLNEVMGAIVVRVPLEF
jgi:hypothetical protein